MFSARMSTLALALATGLALPASAATFTIDLFNGGGDDVADYTGQFTTDATGAITAFSIELGGSTYSTLLPRDYSPAFMRSTYTPETGLNATVFVAGKTFGDLNAFAIELTAVIVNPELPGGPYTFSPTLADWFWGDCDAAGSGCSYYGQFGGGSARITPVVTEPEPSVVPLPATAALLPLGLGALSLIRRRRARAA